MREILFRGKLLSTGEWSYGNLAIKVTGTNIITPDATLVGKYGAVDPSTVGQYIGQVDVDGVKIFEGDILKGAWGTVLQVEFDDSYLQYRAVDSHQHSREIDYYGKVKVIGNVYDNPELLEEVSGDA